MQGRHQLVCTRNLGNIHGIKLAYAIFGFWECAAQTHCQWWLSAVECKPFWHYVPQLLKYKLIILTHVHLSVVLQHSLFTWQPHILGRATDWKWQVMNGVMQNCCPVYHFYNIIKPDNIVIMYHYFRIVSQTLRQKTTVISDAHNNTWTMITEWNYYRCNKACLYCCIGFISKALIAIYPPWNMCISCRLKLGQAPLSSLHVYMTLGCLNSQLDTQKQLCKIKKSLQSSLVRLATVIEGRPAPDDDTAATCIPYWLYFLRPVNEEKSNWIPVFLPGNCSRRVHKEIH